MKKAYPILLFLILLLTISVVYNFHEIINKRPQSVHKWRQSDCASIALNYYQNGMNFFSPETHNLTSDDGTSGECCTSEIPILYYSVALLYKVFGYHDSIFRIFNTLIFFLGLFYLFRILRFLLKDVFWSIAITLLFFTSPVLVFYGNNFLSNSSSLAFSIIGWYYFFRFSIESKPKWFYISMIVFLLAAAFKITALFSLFAIAGIYFLELIGLTKFNKDRKLFSSSVWFPLSIVGVIVVIGSWIVYASIFNEKHGCTYFSTTIFPIWDYTGPEIKAVLNNIRKVWLDQYFHESVLLFLSICFLFFLVVIKKSRKLMIYSILLISLEVVVYIILQFWTFSYHDYYTIDMYILPILLVISVFDVIKRNYNSLFKSRLFKALFSLFLLVNIFFTQQKIHDRYHGSMSDNNKNLDLHTLTPYLRQLGITQNDTVISIPDDSHVSLYLMNQKGWTEYTDANFNRGEKIRYNQDSAGIQSSINKGAKYLVINGIEQIFEKPYLESYTTNLKGRYKNVLIFDLRDSTKNFSLPKRIPGSVYSCNAELLSSDSLHFLSATDSSLFDYGKSQSARFAHSGKYSSLLSADTPYGMTIKLGDLKHGESFEISVWRKTNHPATGGIIASSAASQFYNNNYNVIEEGTNGWEKIQMEFFVSSDLINQELTIYTYNPHSDPVYFDDLEIIRYKSILDEFDNSAKDIEATN